MATELREDRILATSLGHLERRGMHAWGVHGVAHWWRVRHNGLLLAPKTGADALVVRLFALFHDSHREDDQADPGHGPRAADWLARVRDGLPLGADAACDATREAIAALQPAQFALLRTACELHTNSIHHDDATVATCFAADRLDLARVGMKPNPKYIPVDRAILTDAVIADAMARTDAGLSWTDSAEFTRTWGVAIPARRR